MKKLLIFIFSLSFIFLISFISVSADTGPKPYVSITIEGETNGLYLTLLSKSSYNGPYSSDRAYGRDDEEVDAINKKFKEYNDKDGYYYLNYYSSIENHNYKWGYFPPKQFKVLIYDSNNDKFITDDVQYERVYFSTILELKLEGDSFTIINNSSDIFQSTRLLSFFLRLSICLVIELIFALAFKMRKLQLLVVLITNVITQLILNLTLLLMSSQYISILILVYILSEIAIVFIEWFIYKYFINKVNSDIKYTNLGLFIFSLLANASSLIIGGIILGIFGF